jgi:hypothetical protein
LKQEVEQLVVEAKRVGLDLRDVVRAVESQWAKLQSTERQEVIA